MRTIAPVIALAITLAFVMAAMPVPGHAFEPNGKQAKKAADTKGQAGTKGQASTKGQGKPCTEYGEGFVKLEGSSTCVKVNGYVRFQTGGRR